MTNDIPPMLIVEPSGRERRRQLSRLLNDGSNQPDLESIKSRLRKIRQSLLYDNGPVIERFQRRVSGYSGIRVKLARDSREAVDYIEKNS